MKRYLRKPMKRDMIHSKKRKKSAGFFSMPQGQPLQKRLNPLGFNLARPDAATDHNLSVNFLQRRVAERRASDLYKLNCRVGRLCTQNTSRHVPKPELHSIR